MAVGEQSSAKKNGKRSKPSAVGEAGVKSPRKLKRQRTHNAQCSPGESVRLPLPKAADLMKVKSDCSELIAHINGFAEKHSKLLSTRGRARKKDISENLLVELCSELVLPLMTNVLFAPIMSMAALSAHDMADTTVDWASLLGPAANGLAASNAALLSNTEASVAVKSTGNPEQSPRKLTRRRWSQADKDKLRELLRRGVSTTDIAEELGRTASAIEQAKFKLSHASTTESNAGDDKASDPPTPSEPSQSSVPALAAAELDYVSMALVSCLQTEPKRYKSFDEIERLTEATFGEALSRGSLGHASSRLWKACIHWAVTSNPKLFKHKQIDSDTKFVVCTSPRKACLALSSIGRGSADTVLSDVKATIQELQKRRK